MQVIQLILLPSMEIVQLLCVEPMYHSILNKALPEDVNHETGLEKVIDQVATLKKPTCTNSKGVYELKDKYYEEYNVFFYHYTREDQSKSEETEIKTKGCQQTSCESATKDARAVQYF